METGSIAKNRVRNKRHVLWFFTKGPIYGALPTGDLPESGAKMNFAMEPPFRTLPQQ